MGTPLQKTKLYFPTVRPKLVERPRLLERLSAIRAEGCRLVLICAPAGSGKTTVMVQLLSRLAWPVGWVSLDGYDNLPKRFFGYLIAALQTAVPGVGKEAEALLELPGANLEEVVMLLANDLGEAPKPFVLALDDFHAITNPALHQALDFLVEAQPPQMRLVLLSRQDPALQLARRRASGQLLELRQDDLRFSLSETVAFLNQGMDLHLSTSQAETLAARTEGWIAGLQMAALSLQHAPDIERFIGEFSGSHRFILDYLVEEVLAHQSGEIQSFLLDTSILEQMCAELCAATTGRTISNAQKCLEHLAKANLFVVPLDEQRHWYRYHHLFSDLLLSRLLEENPERTGTLNRRAADWYEANDDPRLAVEYAFKAQDLQLAADLIERYITERWKAADLEFLLLVNRLPIEAIAKRPSLCLQRAWNYVMAGQTEHMTPFLEAAERCLLEIQRIPEPSDAGNLAFARTLRAHLTDFQNKPVVLDESLGQAYAAIPEENVGMRNSVAVMIGTIYFMEADFTNAMRYFEDALERDKRVNGTNAVPISVMRIAWVLQAQGRLRQAVDNLHEHAEYIRARGDRRYYIGGVINLLWGEILMEWNQLDEAEAQIREGLRLMEDWPIPTILSLGWSLLSRLQTVRGDLAGARATLEQAERLQQQSRFYPAFVQIFERARVQLWVAEHNRMALEAWVRDNAPLAGVDLRFRYEAQLIDLCRAWLALGRNEEAAELLGRLAESASGRNGSRIAILTLLAAARSGEPGRALAALGEALSLGEPEGYVRTFLEAGEPLRQVLKAWLQHTRAKDSTPLREYAQRHLKAFDEPTAMQPISTTPPTGLVEPLSKREQEVLLLVANGLTNQQIANRLVISIRTVKKHIENIHGKLGVQNRTQAVARSRELGLLRE
jgi:LuxR family maltose regulon positive regulatory protein